MVRIDTERRGQAGPASSLRRRILTKHIRQGWRPSSSAQGFALLLRHENPSSGASETSYFAHPNVRASSRQRSQYISSTGPDKIIYHPREEAVVPAGH